MSCLFIIAIIYFYFLSFFAGFTSTSEGEFACPERFDHKGAKVREGFAWSECDLCKYDKNTGTRWPKIEKEFNKADDTR